jgi:hypothetical protein
MRPMLNIMLRPAPPMTTKERQERFQAAHPGYDRRRKARRRFTPEAMAAYLQAAQASMAETSEADPVEAPVPALPAPVELPLLPALNDLDALLATLSKHAA